MNQSKACKKPKQAISIIKSKEPRSIAVSFDTERCCWRVGRFDYDHPKWGKNNFKTESDLFEFLSKLTSFETRTWNEIKSDTGGRSHGNQSHDIAVASLSREARTRLCELKLDDLDVLYSMRLAGKIRLWGIKEGSCLELLWYDANHEIYPVSR